MPSTNSTGQTIDDFPPSSPSVSIMRQTPSATTFFGHEDSAHVSTGTRTPSSGSLPNQIKPRHSLTEDMAIELDEGSDCKLDEELSCELEETSSLEESSNDELEDSAMAELEDSTVTELDDPSTIELEDCSITELEESPAIGSITFAPLSSAQAISASAEKPTKPPKKFFFKPRLLLCI